MEPLTVQGLGPSLTAYRPILHTHVQPVLQLMLPGAVVS